MTVIVEFTIANEEFLLGQALAEPPDMYIELERLVPTGGSTMPFLWVRGKGYETFERRVNASEDIAEFVALDRLDDGVLYRVEWAGDPHDLLQGITETEGVILEAHGNDGWVFRLRFPNHDSLSRFYNFCTDHDIDLHIDRSYTLTERTDVGHQFGLSREQREALVLGLRRGYFDTPSEVSLDELANELCISQQATSNRIRRGTKQVLTEALLSSATDFD